MRNIFSVLLALIICSPTHSLAQDIFPISDKYSCAKFSDGSATIVLNVDGIDGNTYTLVPFEQVFKQNKADRKVIRGNIKGLKVLKSDIILGNFDKRDKKFLKGLAQKILPEDTILETRKQRVAAADELIRKLSQDVDFLTALDAAVRDCIVNEKPESTFAKYGVRLPVLVKAVKVPADVAQGSREAYVGYLITVEQDVSINQKNGHQIGTRSGFLACAKNMNTGKTFYRIFDDQPCEESEGGENGGNTSLPFADKVACKVLVGSGNWASFGRWYAVSFPTEEKINNAFATLIVNERPFFQVVFYGADPYKSGGPSLDEFKSWCGTGEAF